MTIQGADVRCIVICLDYWKNLQLLFFYPFSLRDDVKMHIVTIGQKKFLANVSIVDVDPKKLEHFEKYIKQTNKSHRACLAMLKEQ